MTSPAPRIVSAAIAVAACLSSVDGHGYVLIPESQFDGSANSAWIVQIEPQWSSDDWDGNTNQSVTTYIELKEEKGVTNIRSFLDDTSIYGADCGYTDPDGTAQPIPSTSTATFSRGIVHVGPCEIWLDDTLAMYNDDCYSAYGGDEDVKSVFPVDYSTCESSGCSQMRFYWLAFQGVDDETVWQVYKDCIPLSSSSSSSTTTTTTTSSDDETTSESTESTTAASSDEDASDNTESLTTTSSSVGAEATSSSNGDTESETDSPTSEAATSTTASSTENTETTTEASDGEEMGTESSTKNSDVMTNDGDSQGSEDGGNGFQGGNNGGSFQGSNEGNNDGSSDQDGNKDSSFQSGNNGGKGRIGGGWSGGFGRQLEHFQH